MKTVFKRQYLYRKYWPALIQGTIDAVGFFLFRPRQERPPKSVRAVLVSRIDHLGDVFIASSILEPLKKAYPSARIDFLAGSWAQQLLNANPLVARHVVHDSFRHNRANAGLVSKALTALSCFVKNAVELRKTRYDMAIDLRTFPSNSITLLFLGGCAFRAGFATGGWGFLLNKTIPYRDGAHEAAHIADALSAIGIKADEKKLCSRITLGKADADSAAALLKSSGLAEGERFALIHTGSGLPAKRWSTEKWQGLINELNHRFRLKTVVVNAQGEELMNCIKLPSLLELAVFSAIAKKAALFVGLDSFPAHVSASFGTPTAVVWCGINDPLRWRPLGKKVAVISKAVECSPCNLKDGCPSMKCMAIDVNDCAVEIEKLLKTENGNS